MKQGTIRALLCASAATALLSGCVTSGKDPAKDSAAPVARAATSTRLVERDVEAPQVFQATDEALWDGRPSLGGVWVASPDAVDPERVIIRNPGNGKFVIGALFRRERLNPGPPLQISSDAAAALGLLAGQPAQVSVIALRREEAPEVAPPDATKPILDSKEQVETTALAAAAIDRAEGKAPAVRPDPLPAAAAPPPRGRTKAADRGTAAARPAPTGTPPVAANDTPPATADGAAAELAVAEPPQKTKKVSFWKRKKAAAPPDAPLDARIDTAALAQAPAATGTAAAAIPVVGTPLPPKAAGRPAGGALQIGIFAVEANARRAVDALARGGVPARVVTETSQGKTFWRVVADAGSDRAATLDKVKAAGFSDAYFTKG